MVRKTYQTGAKQVIVKTDRNLFAKMIMIVQTRQLDEKDVLSHPLAFAWTLAAREETPRKTNKVALAKRLPRKIGHN